MAGYLANGAITFHIGQLNRAGTYHVRVVYGGSSLAESVSQTVTLEVLKK